MFISFFIIQCTSISVISNTHVFGQEQPHKKISDVKKIGKKINFIIIYDLVK